MTEGEQPAQPEQPFDPYRFGKPDYPIPPEYAPPGYVPDVPATTPAPPPVYPGYGASPYGSMPSPYATRPGQQPGYPPYPGYGQQGYGQYGQPPAPAKANGKAVASLTLGIVSIVLSALVFLDLVPIVLALVFGFQTLKLVKAGRSDARGMAVAGIVCALVGLVFTIILTVRAVHAVNECGGFSAGNNSGFMTCVQNHL